jgi:hydrogenase maturation factor
MRELTSHKVNGLNEAIKIEVLDEPGQGGACHHYRMTHPGPTGPINPNGDPSYSEVYFQNGPIGAVGVNGISQEALLAIVEDRLKSFQAGPYACQANADALFHVGMAIETLHKRTRERLARGVEGTHQK